MKARRCAVLPPRPPAGGCSCSFAAQGQYLKLLDATVYSLVFAAACLAQDEAAIQPNANAVASPAAPVDIPPPPASALKDLFGVGTWVQTLAATVSDQIRHFPTEWGHGATHGFGRRAASEYGQVALGNLIESGVQRLHKEDPRYFRVGQGSFFGRTWHVIENTVVVHSTNGGRTVSLALPASAYGNWAIASRWYPDDLRGPGSIFLWGSSNAGMKVAGNFFREFWPDVKGVFKRRPASPPHTGSD
jgi:hypothetical protein